LMKRAKGNGKDKKRVSRKISRLHKKLKQSQSV
jgi:hypothetical protein